MKIKKMVIENFRCFKDEQTIEFDTDGKITLIYGLSGAGKTTLLQFISWVLYNEFSSTSNDDKPLYNQHLDDLTSGSEFVVRGQICFIHNGIDYEIQRVNTYKKKFITSSLVSSEAHLVYKKDNGSWDEYTGDISKKINEIVPMALSKYFFFHGEKSLDLDSNSNKDLKKAIYTMFGLDVYQNALDHLGSKTTKQTVINKYAQLRNNSKSKDVNQSCSDYFKKMLHASEVETQCENKVAECDRKLSYFEGKILEYTQKIGEALNSDVFRVTVRNNENSIKTKEKQIQSIKKEIGNMFYSGAPYLLLLDKAIMTRNLLAENARQEKSFAGLKQELLRDILDKNDECICGRKLDDKAKEHIQKLIDSMPPNSYTYTFNQFIAEAQRYTNRHTNVYENVESKISEIANLKNEIFDLDKINKDLLEKLKSFEKTKEDAVKLQHYKESKKRVEDEKSKFDYDRKRAKNVKEALEDLYNKAVKAEGSINEYDQRIDILSIIYKQIEALYNKRVADTIDTLEKSIREIYLKLSTRIDTLSEDYEDKKFLDADFTLRKEYKTGGQEVIDIYSYVIGMIYALKQLDLEQEGKEFPVIVDAPFSKTDYVQLSHVISVLPTIAPQVALFTFDLDRIKLHADISKIGSVWIIKYNDDQTISTIDRGDL